MAFAVVTSLLEIVEQCLLQPNPSLVLYNTEMNVSLFEKLHFLQAILEASGMKTTDPQYKEIRDVAADAEDKLESKLRQVYLAANRGECTIEACQGLHQTLQQVVKDIELVETRIRMEKTNIASLIGSSTNDFKEENIMVGGMSQNALELEDVMTVRFSTEVKVMVERLIYSRSRLRGLFLIGEGGSGKTTLAKRVYEDPLIIEHFHIRAWVVVSREHNLKEMLIGLLHCILPITSEISNKEEAQLAKLLHQNLMGLRYLIVLDDLWTIRAWHAIIGCFPDNSNQSRILITSRNEFRNEFNGISMNFVYSYHRMNDRSDEDRWELFSRKVFGQRDFVPREYELIGKNIVSCCKLPLAIVGIAGLLVKEPLEIWREVAETLESLDGVDSDNRILEILFLCYNYLPSRLKACFLYFGNFPEDCDIPVKKLISLWVAEGFLKPKKNMSLEEVAESCLLDLISRSLVQVNKLSIDGKIKSCKIHDRLHELCQREAKKENIVCIINENHSLETNRWISCQSSHWPITHASYGSDISNKIRSILYFGRDSYLSRCRLVYPCLKLLRVLDLSLIKYLQGMPSGIADLIHLRYLALRTIGSLNKFQIFKLQNLQTLIVCSWKEEYPLQLSCNILDSPQLRHLHLEKRSSQYLPKSVRENLQTLYWLKVASSDQKPNFTVVPNLKELGIYIEGELAPSCLEGLVHLRLLEKLKLEIGRVEHFCLPTGFPPNLKKLTLRYTYLLWKKMDIIGKLPNLEVLKLKNFAFYGPEWKPTKVGFRRLKVLLIARIDLKHWDAIANHFPVLEHLILRYCWDLKKVPIAFANIETLKLIVIDGCYFSLVTSAKKISSLVASTNNICSQVTSTTMIKRMLRKRDLLRVRGLKTKVALPNNESSEEEDG